MPDIGEYAKNLNKIEGRVESTDKRITVIESDIVDLQKEAKTLWTKIFQIEKERTVEFGEIKVKLTEIGGEIKSFNSSCDVRSKIADEKDDIVEKYEQEIKKIKSEQSTASRAELKTWLWLITTVIIIALSFISLFIAYVNVWK